MRILLAFCLSLVFHLFLASSLYWAPIGPKPSTKDVVFLDLYQSETPQTQLVRQALTPEKQKKQVIDDQPAPFLSEQTQRVKEQTRAPLTGLTKNRFLAEQLKAQKQNTNQNSAKANSENGLLRPAQSGLSAIPTFDRGLSTIGEDLSQKVKVGIFTALNTDKYLYYSFFSRIEELIRYRWESNVTGIINRTDPRQFSSTRTEWITHLEVWLSPNGQVQKTFLLKESGIRGFDQAALNAFKEAKHFPNPPKEMVEADGLIRLKYGFKVYYDPTAIVIR